MSIRYTHTVQEGKHLYEAQVTDGECGPYKYCFRSDVALTPQQLEETVPEKKFPQAVK